MREEDVVSAVYSEGSTGDIVDHIVDDLYIICLVSKPGSGHILKAGALTSSDPSLEAI
jgi:hypothetical protein